MVTPPAGITAGEAPSRKLLIYQGLIAPELWTREDSVDTGTQSRRVGNHFYRKGREERKEDPYRGFTRMHADLLEEG